MPDKAMSSTIGSISALSRGPTSIFPSLSLMLFSKIFSCNMHSFLTDNYRKKIASILEASRGHSFPSFLRYLPSLHLPPRCSKVSTDFYRETHEIVNSAKLMERTDNRKATWKIRGDPLYIIKRIELNSRMSNPTWYHAITDGD